MIGCLRTRVRKQPIITLYFEFWTVLQFYNLEARSMSHYNKICITARNMNSFIFDQRYSYVAQ